VIRKLGNVCQKHLAAGRETCPRLLGLPHADHNFIVISWKEHGKEKLCEIQRRGFVHQCSCFEVVALCAYTYESIRSFLVFILQQTVGLVEVDNQLMRPNVE
jgi:hypothetical protein